MWAPPSLAGLFSHARFPCSCVCEATCGCCVAGVVIVGDKPRRQHIVWQCGHSYSYANGHDDIDREREYRHGHGGGRREERSQRSPARVAVQAEWHLSFHDLVSTNHRHRVAHVRVNACARARTRRFYLTLEACFVYRRLSSTWRQCVAILPMLAV